MMRRLFLGLLISVTILPLRAITLTFPPVASVHGDQMLLGEVAVIAGSENEQAQLKAVVLGGSPAFGQSRELTPGMVRARLRLCGFDPEAITLDSPATVRITRACQLVTGSALVKMAQDWLLGQWTPQEADGRTLASVRVPADIQLPEGALTWKYAQVSVNTPGMQSVTLLAQIDGKTQWQGIISFKIQRTALVLVAKAAINRGAVLDETMVTVERREAAGLPMDALSDPAAVKGLCAAQSLPAGAVITARALGQVTLVQCNTEVRVRAYCGSLVITTTVLALEDGAAGALIHVRNPQTRQEFTARVTGVGELEMVL